MSHELRLITVRLNDGSVVNVRKLDEDPANFSGTSDEYLAATKGVLACHKRTGVVWMREGGSGISSPWVELKDNDLLLQLRRYEADEYNAQISAQDPLEDLCLSDLGGPR